MVRPVVLAMALFGCHRPPAAAVHVTAPAVESAAWSRYLDSIERVVSRRVEAASGLAVLEVRARLAESLASEGGARLPRPIAARAARLLLALDSLFERLSRERAVPVQPPAPVAVRAPPAGEADPPEHELSPAEIDDGGPPVDIVLPPAPPEAVFRWPVSPVRVTSGFGYRRDPLSGRVGFHDGIDLSVPRGTAVAAAAAGTVTYAGPRGGAGNVVLLAHAPGVATAYFHLDRVFVPRGARVAAGDVIGLSGSTGRSTGPHLHFVVRMGGRPVNPMFVVGQGVPLAAAR